MWWARHCQASYPVPVTGLVVWCPGSGCSKLTMLLVNETLKFQTLISQYANIFGWKSVRSFCSAKASLIFSTSNISVFGYKVIKHLKSWPLNELVKLTMLWTTKPCLSVAQKFLEANIIQLVISTNMFYIVISKKFWVFLRGISTHSGKQLWHFLFFSTLLNMGQLSDERISSRNKILL